MATLRDKFIGCIAGVHIGSAMGAVTEHMHWTQIEKEYGYLDRPVPYTRGGKFGKPIINFRAGQTEDGVERQRLMILAIRDKGGRVTAEDVAQAWVKYMNPASFGTISLDFEAVLRDMAKTGIPAGDIGKYCDYAGLNSFARACHPIGLINAGNIKTAKEDILDVGRLYQTADSRGLQWACVTGVAIAAATLPGATVESVLEAIYEHCKSNIPDGEDIVNEIRKHVEGSAYCKNIKELRDYFEHVYDGMGFKFCMAQAQEVVTRGICVFAMVRGNTKEAILAGVNMGRDTDCISAVAAGISGALTGYDSIPQEWFDIVDETTAQCNFTCSNLKIMEFADCVYDAYQKRLMEQKAFVEQMKNA